VKDPLESQKQEVMTRQTILGLSSTPTPLAVESTPFELFVHALLVQS